jgi:solute carrier family 25 citrate transporter 1
MYRALLFLSLINSAARTKLIDDAKGPNPQYRGLIHGTTQIVKKEGLRGIYRGLFPVVNFYLPLYRERPKYSTQMMRQGANSAIRFTTYTTLKQFVQGTARPGQNLPSSITFGIGAVAGLVTVYTTMPLEFVSVSPSFLPFPNWPPA